MAASGALAGSSNELRLWLDRSSKLEAQLDDMARQKEERAKTFGFVQRDLQDKQKKNDALSHDRACLQRRLHNLEAKLATSQAEAKEVRTAACKLEKDKGGLCRSLEKTRLRLGHATKETQHQSETVETLTNENDANSNLYDSLTKSLGGMAEMQGNLTKQVALERDKRQKLKDAVRRKLEKVDADQEVWKAKLNKHDDAQKKRQGDVKEQEENTRKAEAETSRLREHAQGCESLAAERLMEKEEMHQQLRELRRIHEKLRSDFHAAQAHLSTMEQKRSEDSHQWRMEHIEALDKKLLTRRELDQEQVIASSS